MEEKNLTASPQEIQVGQLITDLEKQLTEARKRLEEIRNPKPKFRHGDYGYFGGIESQPRLIYLCGDFLMAAEDNGFVQNKDVLNGGFDYTILGNVFDDLKGKV